MTRPVHQQSDAILAFAFVLSFVPTTAVSAADSLASAASVIPPIVLQGCDAKIKAARSQLFLSHNYLSGSSRGSQNLGFDVSFINTTNKVANLVIIRIGGTDFAKVGTFSPNAVIAERIAARGGDCSVRAVRFVDGSEWSASDAPPDDSKTVVPAASAEPR